MVIFMADLASPDNAPAEPAGCPEQATQANCLHNFAFPVYSSPLSGFSTLAGYP